MLSQNFVTTGDQVMTVFQHRDIPAAKPKEAAEVERSHRKLNEYVFRRRDRLTFAEVNPVLERTVNEMSFILPSCDKNC
jgi:hypothetical protein